MKEKQNCSALIFPSINFSLNLSGHSLGITTKSSREPRRMARAKLAQNTVRLASKSVFVRGSCQFVIQWVHITTKYWGPSNKKKTYAAKIQDGGILILTVGEKLYKMLSRFVVKINNFYFQKSHVFFIRFYLF